MRIYIVLHALHQYFSMVDVSVLMHSFAAYMINHYET